ncbi:hypothetical protein SODG_002432 [Sodalis praecaptivus]
MVDSDVNREAAAGNAASQTAVTTARQLRLTLISSVVGTALEWYDLYLYGTAVALIFNHLFFPSYRRSAVRWQPSPAMASAFWSVSSAGCFGGISAISTADDRCLSARWC